VKLCHIIRSGPVFLDTMYMSIASVALLKKQMNELINHPLKAVWIDYFSSIRIILIIDIAILSVCLFVCRKSRFLHPLQHRILMNVIITKIAY